MILCADRISAGKYDWAGYSQDLRDRVLAAVHGGLRVSSAAPLFRVSVSYIYKTLGWRRSTGDEMAHRSGGGPKPKLGANDDALRAQVMQQGDVTLIERQAWLAGDHAVKVSVCCLWARLRHLGLTLKKVAARHRAGLADVAEARRQWRAQRANGDRTIWCLSTKSAHRSRWPGSTAELARRAPVTPVPCGHWKTTTLIGALRRDRLVAPCAFDGPINGETVRAWVEQFLVPELKSGDIVILDNLPSHKVEGVRASR